MIVDGLFTRACLLSRPFLGEVTITVEVMPPLLLHQFGNISAVKEVGMVSMVSRKRDNTWLDGDGTELPGGGVEMLVQLKIFRQRLACSG